MKKKTKFIIGFWLVFIVLFLIGHVILSKIIMYYKERPAIETAEAYDVMKQYQQGVLAFYDDNGYCPSMADKERIEGKPRAYHYVESIRLLRDKTMKTCFISAVMRKDTPSRSVKNKILVMAYNASIQEPWKCYTNIKDEHVISACFDHPLPIEFEQALTRYLNDLKENE